MNQQFQRIERLPPYVFNIIGELKQAARARGEDTVSYTHLTLPTIREV